VVYSEIFSQFEFTSTTNTQFLQLLQDWSNINELTCEVGNSFDHYILKSKCSAIINLISKRNFKEGDDLKQAINVTVSLARNLTETNPIVSINKVLSKYLNSLFQYTKNHSDPTVLNSNKNNLIFEIALNGLTIRWYTLPKEALNNISLRLKNTSIWFYLTKNNTEPIFLQVLEFSSSINIIPRIDASFSVSIFFQLSILKTSGERKDFSSGDISGEAYINISKVLPKKHYAQCLCLTEKGNDISTKWKIMAYGQVATNSSLIVCPIIHFSFFTIEESKTMDMSSVDVSDTLVLEESAKT